MCTEALCGTGLECVQKLCVGLGFSLLCVVIADETHLL